MLRLYSIASVLYSQGVIWQIWVLYSSDQRFQMELEPGLRGHSNTDSNIIQTIQWTLAIQNNSVTLLELVLNCQYSNMLFNILIAIELAQYVNEYFE